MEKLELRSQLYTETSDKKVTIEIDLHLTFGIIVSETRSCNSVFAFSSASRDLTIFSGLFSITKNN